MGKANSAGEMRCDKLLVRMWVSYVSRMCTSLYIDVKIREHWFPVTVSWARWLPSNWSVITVIIIVCTQSLLRNITSCGGSHRVPRSRGKNIPSPLPARSAHYPPHHLALRHRVETTMIQGQRWCLMFKVLSPFVFPEKINGGGWWWGTGKGKKSC